MKEYNHKKIELKVQKEWEKKKSFQAKEKKSKKFYGLIEFPYPSGDGLHVGHPRPYIGMDVISRKKRMEGYNVLFPIGWDAFGLPTENYAIKTGIHPKIVTKKNTDNFRRQIKMLGISFDWSREINTTDPSYYKWTQWLFLQFFKKGLAYKNKSEINWCPKDKIGLANEEVVDGRCERCGTLTEKKEKEQWMLAITKYADRLDKDLDLVDYPERVKLSQKNWIGKSEGSEIEFSIKNSTEKIKVFTTRADTLFGVTYVVLAPEHPLLSKTVFDRLGNKKEVEEYIKKVKNKSDLERTENKEKSGVELKGIKAINPANGEEISVWVADYVLSQYGTGAVMAVPAHDERDFEFAKKYGLEIKQVIMSCENDTKNPPRDGFEEVKRDTIIVFLKNKETEKYALLNWHNSLEGITTAIMGGIEIGQTPEQAVLTEIQEEASLTGIKITKKLRWITAAKYCASHKNQNRCAISHVYLAEIDNIKNQGEIEEYEKNTHTLIWVDKKEVLNKLTPNHQKFIWEQLFNETALVDDGILMNSGKFNGMDSEEVRAKITEFVGGKIVTKFKLRDWVFSRQRYWGEPIPIVNCPKCGLVPLKEKDLPLKLPDVKSYKPTNTGESPLAGISKWVNTKCPKCKGKAKRETDTMPNWAGSSWYYLRYTDPKNKNKFADMKKLKYWLGKNPKHGGVDWYNGGMEHTTLHLLYSRFWHKFLYDLKLVPTAEPYAKRTSHGMILGAGGVKMSKSLGNVVNPDQIVKTYGADTLRVYEMFMGPFEDAAVWNTESIIGSRRFIEKVWRIGEKIKSSSSHTTERKKNSSNSIVKLLHKTIKKVSEDIEAMRFNTAISSMMILTTEMEKAESVSKDDYKKFLQILSPFAPHIAEEIWNSFGEKKSINYSKWPSWDENLIKDEEIKIIIQVNGKVRAEIMISADENEENIKKNATMHPSVQKFIENREIKRIIYVKNKLVNLVI
ncbi:MAG TPA: class I tRNA ligase family protein [Candidatus Paceibacterota bacterium]|nr:class I tRNA ligase family protein [Candidatus Paceibacterota bacterium]HPT17874.1 class I tRNA ligase family protein [Candidatus Paceibacterota bacterium]